MIMIVPYNFLITKPWSRNLRGVFMESMRGLEGKLEAFHRYPWYPCSDGVWGWNPFVDIRYTKKGMEIFLVPCPSEKEGNKMVNQLLKEMDGWCVQVLGRPMKRSWSCP